MSSATLCIKFLIYGINFVIWCLGFVLLGIGVWIRSDTDFWEYHNTLPIPQYYVATYIAIVIGVVLLITGFLGCFGAAVDSPCLLISAITFTALMVVCQIMAACFVWKIAEGEKLQEFLVREIRYQIELSKGGDDQAKRFLNLLQLHLECCGGSDMNDYRGTTIPQSCNSDRTNNIFIHGCGENLRRYLEIKAGTLGGICLGLGLMEIMSLMLMLLLFCIYRQESKADL